ncbi:MAG: MMPL family transporter [Pirellulales bacterium]|nr:MMPL family transporter [Pirellulales bacterium]
MSMYRLGRFAHDHRWAVIAAWVVAAAGLRLATPDWRSVARDSDVGELPAYTTTARGLKLNAAAFPNDTSNSQLVFVLAREDRPLTAEDRAVGLRLARRLEELPDVPLVGPVWTEQTPVIGDMLSSPAGKAVEVVARLSNDFMAVDNVRLRRTALRLLAAAQAEAPAGLQIGVTGSAAIGGDLLAAMSESLRATEFTTIAAVALALALIYRSPWLIVVPLGAIAVATIVSIDLLALLAQWSELRGSGAWPEFRVYSTTRIFIVVLLFGAGTDFCLFLIARFRELRSEGASQREGIVESVGRVGHALAASAGTTIAGLSMMVFAEFGKFAYSGPAIAIALAIALAVCLTLAPALLATPIGRRLYERPRRLPGTGQSMKAAPQQRPRAGGRCWNWVADVVTARPGLVLAASLAAAAPLAWQGVGAPVTYDIFSELPPDAPSKRGAELLLRHLPPGEIGPLTLLVRLPGEDFASDGGRRLIRELSKRLFDLKGVDKVRSLYRPTGEPPGAVSLFSSQGWISLAAAGSPLAEETFVSQATGGEVTRLTIVLAHGPFSAEAVATADQIAGTLRSLQTREASPWRKATFEMLGVTAGIRDLERITSIDGRRIQLLVTIAVYLVILVLLRRPLVCGYLIATVVLNYYVTLGLVNLALGALHGDDYAGLDWKAPIFLFVILVAVGQDYNILLATRVAEEQRRLGPLAGVHRGLTATGGIITSCGVIMAATFGSMTSGSLPEMAEMGGALALGILLDTFIVRPILAPAFLALMARRHAGAGGA